MHEDTNPAPARLPFKSRRSPQGHLVILKSRKYVENLLKRRQNNDEEVPEDIPVIQRAWRRLMHSCIQDFQNYPHFLQSPGQTSPEVISDTTDTLFLTPGDFCYDFQS